MSNKHHMVTALERGTFLIGESNHQEAISLVQTATESGLLQGISMNSLGLPKDVQALMPDDDYWPHPQSWFAQLRPYKVKDGVLVIPVRGVLLHGVGITYGRYITGYEYIIRAVHRAEADPMVKRVVFQIDSPGGHVSGCFDTADLIWGMSKPTMAFVTDLAASAGYAIAAQCRTIVGTQTVEVGHIGVLATLVDVSASLKQRGVELEYVTAPKGGHKAEGHAGTPITKHQRDRAQEGVDEVYEIFVNVVTRARPITDEAIRETKAMTYRKEASLEMGLIDSVASSVDILAAAADVFDRIGDIRPEKETVATTQPGLADPAPVNEEKKMTDEEKAALVAQARTEAAAEATTAATKRIGDILGSPEAEGREDLAKHFAFNTTMSAEDALASLKVAAKSAPAVNTEVSTETKPDQKSQGQQFDAEMAKHAPNLEQDQSKVVKTDEDKAAASLAASKALAKKAGIGGYA